MIFPLRKFQFIWLTQSLSAQIWGLLRLISGSVLVASVSHGVWNGLDYPLFGFGTKVGALGITETAIYGPEVGILGLIVNVVFASCAVALAKLTRH